MTRLATAAALALAALVVSCGDAKPDAAAPAAPDAPAESDAPTPPASPGGPAAPLASAAPAAPAAPGDAEAARLADLRTHVAGDGPAPTRELIDAAIDRGIAYLVGAQNADGGWGSTAPTLYVDIYAPGPGSHESYAVATSALAVAALAEAGGDRPGVADALRKGTDYLVAHSRVRRSTLDVLYNTWSSGYSLEAFARVLDRETDPERRTAILAACADNVDMLTRFDCVEGGWGYYDFQTGTRHPGDMSTSFTTATVLTGLALAKEKGVEVPQAMVDKALRALRLMRKPDGAFAYSFDHRYWPQAGINKIKGSLARTPACYTAILAWGGPVTGEQVRAMFENLRKEGRFLAIARKYPFPHEAWYQNSGYFCFYGYDYATRLLGQLPPELRAEHAASIASYLVPLQEPDGSWWDYQLYGYHKPYGTAMVTMALARCR